MSPVKSDAGESAAALLMMLGAASAPSPAAPSGVNLLCDSEVEDVEEEDYKENVLDEDDEYNSGCEAAVPQFAGGHFRAAAAAPMLPKATKTKGRGAHAAIYIAPRQRGGAYPPLWLEAREARRHGARGGWPLALLVVYIYTATRARRRRCAPLAYIYISRPLTRAPKPLWLSPPARPPFLSLSLSPLPVQIFRIHSCVCVCVKGVPSPLDPQAPPPSVAPRSQLKLCGRRALRESFPQSARVCVCVCTHVCVCVCVLLCFVCFERRRDDGLLCVPEERSGGLCIFGRVCYRECLPCRGLRDLQRVFCVCAVCGGARRARSDVSVPSPASCERV